MSGKQWRESLNAGSRDLCFGSESDYLAGSGASEHVQLVSHTQGCWHEHMMRLSSLKCATGVIYLCKRVTL